MDNILNNFLTEEDNCEDNNYQQIKNFSLEEEKSIFKKIENIEVNVNNISKIDNEKKLTKNKINETERVKIIKLIPRTIPEISGYSEENLKIEMICPYIGRKRLRKVMISKKGKKKNKSIFPLIRKNNCGFFRKKNFKFKVDRQNL